MKIIYISNSIIPSRTANSIQVMKMCQAFADNGNEVLLLYPSHIISESDITNIYKYYGVRECFQSLKLPCVRSKFGLYLYEILAAVKAKKMLPQLVYTRSLRSCFFCGLIGLNSIYEAHKLIYRKINSCFLLKTVKSKYFKNLIVISDALKHDFQGQYNIPNYKITTVHDAADEPRQYDKLKLDQPNRFKVGYVGHLYPGKGMELIAELSIRCSWADFHIVGGTNSDLDYWRVKLDHLKNIYFHGFIPPAETEKYRQSCDVLIAPYQRRVSVFGGGGDVARWMSPLKIFEYMASGKAIIASDLPVLREVLIHEVTAILYEPEDIEAWVTGLINLRDNDKMRNYLGKRAREEFKKKYTWKARAEKVLQSLT
ncbi:glycosyltransferase family 4 protein [Coleofasciculus sp. E1-EBD-02]|uniref:glycosyltransferase family 4 protein n=1 Tax=Coleofasciculus sp. E1-EBD-02 TaxID=3068481 RepID=UPI003304259B